MRKFFTLYVPPIIGAILIAIKLPDIDKWLKEQNENSGFIIGCILVGATVLTHIITVISPFKKYEKIEKNKWVLLDIATADFLGDQIFPGNHLVANVMLPKKVFYSKLEPCPKKTWVGKTFYKKRFFAKMLKPIWLSNNHTLNKKFKITTNQGVSGRSFTLGKPAIVDIKEGINELNLNEEQKKQISGNGFVISYPIFAFDERYSRLGTEIIGVVTLSCSTLGCETIIAEEKNREILTEKIVEFSKICSLLL